MNTTDKPDRAEVIRGLRNYETLIVQLLNISQQESSLTSYETTCLLPVLSSALTLLSQDGEDAKGWQPISTAPKDGTTILVHSPLMGRVIVEWSGGGWDIIHDFADATESTLRDATHWQPLPEPPSSAMSATTEGGEGV